MKKDIILTIIGFSLAGSVLLLTVCLYLPFFQPIAWAAVIALLLNPINHALCKVFKNRRGLVAFILCICFVAFIFIPVVAALTKVTTQAINVVTELSHKIQEKEISLVPDKEKHPRFYALGKTFFKKVEKFQEDIESSLLSAITWIGQFILSRGTTIFRNTVKIVLQVVFMVVTLFYLFRDGELFVEGIKALLPVPRKEADNIIKKIQQVLEATLYGSLLTSLAQGVLGILIFALLGFGSSILLGILIALASFIPLVGTALVWGPAVFYLIVKGFYVKALILFLYSSLIISQIDSIIRPFFISGRTEIHNLFIFFSILGGIKLFGFLGIFLGPILVAMSISIIHIYRAEILNQEKNIEPTEEELI